MKKKIDRLSQCAVEANRFGLTYGKYMALYHPENRPPEPSGYKHTCASCGKDFYVWHMKARKYCSEKCRNHYYHEKYHKKVAEEQQEVGETP